MKLYVKNKSTFDIRMKVIHTVYPDEYTIKSLDDNEPLAEIAVDLSEFDLSLEFIFDYDMVSMDDVDRNTIKDKFLAKLSEKALSAFEKLIFRVDCSYHISGIYDGDTIEIDSPIYLFGVYDVLDFLEMMPVEYVFPRVRLHNGSAVLTAAVGQNRNKFLKASKRLALFYYGISGIWKFPFQYGRVKHLTKDHVVFKKLRKFLSLTPQEQEKKLDKQSKLIDS